jgi:integrase
MTEQALDDVSVSLTRLDAIYGSCQSWINFQRGITTKTTRKTYVDALGRFIRYLKAENPDKLLEGSPTLLENQILGYIAEQKTKGLSSAVIKTRLAAIKLFYEMNRMPLSWTFIRRTIGKTKRKLDKAYSREQIAKVLSIADHREKAMVGLLASTGIREGAISELDVGHLVPLEKYGIYKIVVYEGYDEQYVTYCTPETKIIIDEYLAYRKRYGEDINAKSPLIREQFDKNDLFEIKNAKRLSTRMVIGALTKLLVAAGVRPKVTLTEGQSSGKIRHEIKLAHGFRKYFDTQMSLAGVSEIWTQLLEGHNIGLKGAYLRPLEQDLLEGNDRMRGYVAAVDYLTVNEEFRLKTKVTELEQKLEDAPTIELMQEELKKEREERQRLYEALYASGVLKKKEV